jgi:uncharacterized SAM-binding protein YcdF (DUF218 family)
MRDYVIVFGAAVRPDGSPSAALRHRIDGAVAWAREHPAAIIMPTGGVGAKGSAEADVMERGLLAAGIEPDRIVSEPHAQDTLESVRLCDRLLRRQGDCGRVVCCTSAYHQPRCALLLRMLGYEVVVPKMPDDRGRLAWPAYVRLLLKESIATPYDALLLFLRPRLPMA